jgi:hypothetical protein
MRYAGGEFDHFDAARDFAFRVGEGLAVFLRDDLREILPVRVHELAEAHEDPRPALPGDGTYDVSFQAMSGAFSYTIIVSATITEIVLHSTFLGYPPNTDPDGNQLGAAKGTCAHEFKHASQYTTSSWSEGGWTELDATWAEDIVYPATNRYWNYVNNNGPNILGQPWTSLDDGGTGSYEDCLWELHLSGAFGNVLLVDLWNTVRANHRTDTMKKSYQDVLVMHGSSWDLTYPNFLDWAWFTGSRALPPYGFPDAPNLKRMNVRGAAVALYPFAVTDSVAALAAHPRRFNPGIGIPRIIFDGSDGTTSWTVSVITKEPSGSFTIVHPVLDGTSACNYQVPMLWSSLEYVGVIVTNAKRLPPAQPYTLEVLDEEAGDAPSVGAAAQLLTQLPPTPNPTKGSTLLRFALPSAARASVRIYDVSGRIVRTLVDAPMPAGPGQITWDGRDSSAAPVAAGVYWSRVESRDASVTQKVTILR